MRHQARRPPPSFQCGHDFLIYNFKRLYWEVRVLFNADNILFCLPGCGRVQQDDLRALLHILIVFGYFLGLKVNYAKMFAAGKVREGTPCGGGHSEAMGQNLGVLLGSVSGQQAYGPTIAKMMTMAKTLASLPLGMVEKAYLFTTWFAPVLYLTAQAQCQ